MRNPLYGQNSYDENVGEIFNPGEPNTAIGTGAQTITIDMIRTQVLEEDPEGAATWTLTTAALAVAGISGVEVGDCLDFYVVNTDATNDIAITIAAGTGGTLVGNMEVESPEQTAEKISSGSGMFRFRFTNVTSGSEAYSVYRLA